MKFNGKKLRYFVNVYSSSNSRSSNSNRNRMFGTNDILNNAKRANIQLLWLLPLKTKISMRFDVVVLGTHCSKYTFTSSKANHTDGIDGYLRLFFVFMEPCYVRVCLPHFVLLIFCTICLVASSSSKWIDFFFYVFGFFLSQSLSTFVFLSHLSVVQKLGPSIVMTTHNSYYIIASISQWTRPLKSRIFFFRIGFSVTFSSLLPTPFVFFRRKLLMNLLSKWYTLKNDATQIVVSHWNETKLKAWQLVLDVKRRQRTEKKCIRFYKFIS